jgi:hypothetical protein
MDKKIIESITSDEWFLIKKVLKLELISITDDEDWIYNNKEEVEALNNLIKKLNLI